MNNLRVGFVGLGDMGGAMAQRIIDEGYPTTLWARRDSSLAPYRERAAVVGTPRELGEVCDVVGVCVFGDEDVRQVALGDGDGILYGMAPGGVLAIHSTISVETCVELESLGRERGITVLDAPVSGGRQSAEAGELVVMVGGDTGGFQIASPVFETFGSTVRHLGAIGSGQRAKVLNNVLCFCNLRMGHLALGVAQQMSLDSEAVQDVLCNASGRSFSLEELVKYLIPNPDFARHAETMVVKDTELYQQVCRNMGIAAGRLDEIAWEAVRTTRDLSGQGGQEAGSLGR